MQILTQDHHVQFFTAVCKDWLPLLQSDAAKSNNFKRIEA